MAQDNQQPRQPIKVFRTGHGVEAAIWANEVTQDSRTFTQHSVRVQKRYRDKNGNFQSTDYFWPDDLPRACLAAQKAFEFVALRESESSPDNVPA